MKKDVLQLLADIAFHMLLELMEFGITLPKRKTRTKIESELDIETTGGAWIHHSSFLV